MISELSKAVGITTTIKDYGAKEEDFEMLAEKAMNDPCKPGNPREVTKEDFINLYRQAMWDTWDRANLSHFLCHKLSK